MLISILQLNINSDNHWDKLTNFLKKSDFDILMFQEVTGRETKCGNIDSKRDVFKELQALLCADFNGELAKSDVFTSSPQSYNAVSIFFKKQYTLIDKNILTLHKRKEPFPSEAKSFEGLSRNLLHIRLLINNKYISFLTIHAAWAKTPQEEPHQTMQGEILLSYLKTIPAPFILTGDFNLDPQQPLIKKISMFTRNLISENNITNTLNPRIHRSKALFPPGAAVDYIFITHDVALKEFSVIEEDISDHFGLSAKIVVDNG